MTKCKKCDSKIIYAGLIQNTQVIVIDHGVLFDKDVLSQDFFWVCSGCGRKLRNSRDDFTLKEVIRH